MGHPATPLSPMGTGGLGGVPHMDGWVLEETKKLEAQQRIQHRKLLDLKQVCACVCVRACVRACVCVGMRRLECFTRPQIVSRVLPVMCVLL